MDETGFEALDLLLGTLTLCSCEAIDATRNHCEYQKSFPGHAMGRDKGRLSRGVAQENVGPGQQIEFLGCARLDAYSRSGDVAIWREHAVFRTCRPGRNTIYPGLWDRFAIAGIALERATFWTKSGNPHPRNALSLGSYPGNSVLHAALCGKQCISFL